MPPITDVREISNLAYGFIGSKVLFSALNPDAVSLTPGGLTAALAANGFTDVTVRDVIPGLTRLAIARKPA